MTALVRGYITFIAINGWVMIQLSWIKDTGDRIHLVREDINCVLNKLNFIYLRSLK
jgi:hypothetical protein